AGEAPAASRTFALNCWTTVLVMHWTSGTRSRRSCGGMERSNVVMTIPSLVLTRSGSVGVISAPAFRAGHPMSLSGSVSPLTDTGWRRGGPRAVRRAHRIGCHPSHACACHPSLIGGTVPEVQFSHPAELEGSFTQMMDLEEID